MSTPRLSGEEVARLVVEAGGRIRPHIHRTPIIPTHPLSADTRTQVFLKLDNEQVTGSFKARGAFNKVLQLAGQGVTSVYTASTGNHGIACGLAFKTVGVDGQVVIPSTADPEKKEKLKAAGCGVLEHGTDCETAEKHARSLAVKASVPYLSPYNDYHVMAGQGTIGLEILEDLPDVGAIFVSVGGGGLIGGIAAYVKWKKPDCQIVGCSPVRSKVMHESVKAGRIIQEESLETLSDGTAGNVEEGSVTFDLCRDLVDRWVLVEEEEIAQAVFYCLKHHKKVVEGSAGVALAAIKKVGASYQDKKVVAVLCGANISLNNLQNIINTYANKEN